MAEQKTEQKATTNVKLVTRKYVGRGMLFLKSGALSQGRSGQVTEAEAKEHADVLK